MRLATQTADVADHVTELPAVEHARDRHRHVQPMASAMPGVVGVPAVPVRKPGQELIQLLLVEGAMSPVLFLKARHAVQPMASAVQPIIVVVQEQIPLVVILGVLMSVAHLPGHGDVMVLVAAQVRLVRKINLLLRVL